MSVYSMTGYAAVQSNSAASGEQEQAGTDTNTRLGVEIRSVNSRFLDLAFRLPDAIRAELKATAEKEGRTMSNMILRLITEGLESRRIAK